MHRTPRSVHRGRPAVAQPLESRRLLAAVAWTGGAGNWNDPTQWSAGAVPGSGDDVTVPAGATVTVSDGESAGTLTTAAGSTLDITATGTLGNANGGTVSGTVNDAGLLYGSSASTAPLVLAGTTTVTAQWNSGYFRNAGQANFTGAGAIADGPQVTNDGTLTVTGGANLNSGAFTNDAGATIALADDATTTGGTIYNGGTIAKTGGTGASILTGGGTLFDYGGTIAADAGTLAIADQSYFQNTTFTAAGGAAVELDNTLGTYTGNFDFSGTVTGSGAGNFNFVNGTTYPGNPTTGGNQAQTTYALNFPAGFAQVLPGMSFRGDNPQMTNAGYLQFTGAAQHAALDLDNKGTLVVTGTGDLGFGNQTAFLNDATGVIDLTTDAGLADVGDGNGGGFNLTNQGLVEKTGGTGTSSIGTAGVDGAGSVGVGFEDEGGTISAQSGTLDFPAGGAFENTTFTAASGTAISLDDADGTGDGVSYYLSGTLTGSGAGNLLFAGNGVTTRGPYDNSFTPTAGAILNFPAGFAQVTGTIFSGGGATEIVNQGTLDYIGAAQHLGMGIDNKGTIDVTGTGDLGAGSDGAFINDTTGVLDFQSDAGVAGVGGNTAFTNLGLIEKTGGTGQSIIGTAAGGGIGFVNTGGAFAVTSGVLTLTDGDSDVQFTFGGITAAPGSAFDLNLGGGRFFGGGTFAVTGGGTFQFDGGTWDDQSTTAPCTLDFAPGTFNVGAGDFGDNVNVVNAGEIDLPGVADLSAILNQGTVRVTGVGPLTSTLGFVNGTAGVLDFAADATISDSYHADITNNGTILKSGGTGTLDVSNNSFTNNGTVESASGTINLSYGSTLPAGSTLEADAGGTITTTTNGITDDEGTVILNGGSIPAVAGLATVGGTFEVLAGSTFTTAGDLADTGTVTVGGTLNVTGAFTMSQSTSMTNPPVLAFAVGTTVPRLSVTGATTLAGTLTAGYTAGSAAAAAGTAYTVAAFATAAVGAFADTSGTSPAFTPSVTAAAIEFNATGTGGATPTPTPTPNPTPTVTKTIGGLDPGFGTAGLASHDVGFTSTAGVAADGAQSVLVGPIGTSPDESFGVTRYNADGSLDATFGTAGVTTTPFAGTDAVPAAVAVLSDGDILVAGTATTYAAGAAATGSAFAVAEYTAAGALDPAFGTAGQALVSFSTTAGSLSDDVLRAIAVGPGGVIYLGGSSDAAGKGNADLAVAALTAAGGLETTFGAGGKTLADVAGGDDVVNALAVQRNGDVVAAGSATVGGVSEIALARFLTTGAPDPRFGTKGLVTDKVGAVYDAATSVVVQANGAIVVGGLTATGSAASLSSDFVVQRYTTAGRPDRTFGTAGTAVTSFGQPAAVTQVVLSSSGEVVASGKTTASLASVTPDTLDVAIARYTTRGTLDTTFNSSGKVIVDLATGVVAASTSVTPGEAVPGQTMVPLSLAAAAGAAATLSAAFDAFTSSEQGVVAVTQGGEILSAGNSGADTVEAELVAAGVDLVAKLLSSLPASALAGLKATATVSVSEGGTTPAVGTVTLTLSVATDAAGDGAVTVKTLAERVNLKQGQGRTYKVPFAYPATASGGYYLLASVTDGSALPADLNPANNTAASPAAVDVAPAFVSLGGSALSTAATLEPGRTATVSLDVTNDGNVTAKGRVALELLLSTDASPDDGIQVAGLPEVVGLAPGKSKGLRVSFKLAAGFRAGTYDLIALVDPTDGLGSDDRSDAVVVDASPVNVS
jgi:fibronectin-binding autotransporter adhesin